jgi:hypothetical protein
MLLASGVSKFSLLYGFCDLSVLLLPHLFGFLVLDCDAKECAGWLVTLLLMLS